MTDVFTKEKRSEIMSNIKEKNTSIELKVRSFLHKLGYRFRVNDKRYIGKPDIVLPKYRTIIFVNGCFWHGHSCKYSTIPKSNTEFWMSKINKTKIRDELIVQQLKDDGWNVIVIWECEIKHSFDDVMRNLIKQIEKNERL